MEAVGWGGTLEGLIEMGATKRELGFQPHLLKVKVAQSCLGLQSCPILCGPMDYTVQGILQARILE